MNNKKKILILIILLFLIALFYLRHYFSIFYFQNDIKQIVLNIETTQNIGDIYVCYNQNCEKTLYKNNIYSTKLNQEKELFYKNTVNNLEIIILNKNIDKIKALSLFNGFEFNYYAKEIKAFPKKEIDFSSQNSIALKIPFKNNSKTLLQKFAIYFEGIFYNWYFHIFSYILLLFYLFKYKEELFIKIKYPLFLFLLLGFILRISHIDFIPLWNDELYTCYTIANHKNPFLSIFKDPGNPPLFFIISNVWLYFFNQNIFQIRFLAVIIGIIQLYSIYFVTLKILNKKTALVALFLNTINIFIILESNEIRSYILSMTLILWGGYWFYKLYSNFNKKNLLIYSIFVVLLVNLHYYAILFIFSNLFLGLILFKNNRLKFLLANLISYLSFLPYFLTTMVNKSFEANFNSWIEKPSINLISNHITFYFGNIIFFILIILFITFIFKKGYLKENNKKIFLYNIYSISFVFIFALLISFIKPMLFERYFCIFLPILIINTSILLNLNYKTTIKPLVLLLVFLFSINMPKYENFNLFNNIDALINFSIKDYKSNPKYDSYFIIPDNINYIEHYKNNFKDINKNKIIISNYGIREDVDSIKEYLKNIKNKKIIFYIPEICANSKIRNSKTLNVQKINTTLTPLYKVIIN